MGTALARQFLDELLPRLVGDSPYDSEPVASARNDSGPTLFFNDVISMLYAIASKDLGKSNPYYLQIKEPGTTDQVFVIKSHLYWYRQLISPVYLSPARKPGDKVVHAKLGSQCDKVLLIE